MDFPRSLAWGGGGLLVLVAVALLGAIYLPGWARLILVAAAALGVRVLWRWAPEGPERDTLLPVTVGVVVWFGLVWGFGLLSPAPTVGLVALAVLSAGMWWHYGELIDAEQPVPEEIEEAPPEREPTPDERFAELLAEAPMEGLEFAVIVTAMAPYWSRSTTAARLNERAWKIGHGRWRGKPRGAPQENA
jgi:hypothetical protein